MKYESIHAIINPNSSGGATGRNWQDLETEVRKNIGSFSFEFTDMPGSATKLTAAAIKENVHSIIVVGGDGTVSEAVNGYFSDKGKKKSTLSILNLGTGGDFCRTLGIPSDIHLALENFKKNRLTKVDVGHLEYKTKNGDAGERYFVNVAGCGMAGEVVEAVNKSAKRFGAFSYYLAATGKLLKYKNKKIRISMNGGPFQSHSIVTLAICNGQFFGGGMQIAPNSEITDGLFHITVLEDWSMAQKILLSRHLYNGGIYNCAGVKTYTCNKIVVEPEDPRDVILIDSDGDCPGILPMKAEVIPQAIHFRV